jgi:hypothetical protein
MDILYPVDHESRVHSNLSLTPGQIFKQSFYYTCDDINKLAASIGDKQVHQVQKPIKYGYLESSILNKILPSVLLQRETICIRKNINFHKLMYAHVPYLALVNVREVQENSLVLISIAVVENDHEKLMASGEALLHISEKGAEEKMLLRKGLRITSQ